MELGIEEIVRLARRFAMKWRSSPADADDIAQDAALRYVGQIVPPRNAAVWLFVVTRRLCHAQTLRRRAQSEAESEFSETRGNVCHSSSDVRLDIRMILNRLSASDRRLLLLNIEGAPASAIAREFGCKVPDVGQMVARARRKARRLR